jgi:hypothetical protein
MICSPYRLSRPDRYCRLLPPFQHSGNPEKVTANLEELARSMFREEPEPPPIKMLVDAVVKPPGPPAAAYTYFGQFIMHDLTFDDTPFRSAGVQEPEETVNYRTPRLDLDSVYGDGPFSSRHRHLYDGIRFLIGTSARNPTAALFDVPLIDDLPTVVDERNCENAILRQIHAMFLKLHNLAVDNLCDVYGDPEKLFQAARARVRWQYQWLVRHDFLPNVCDNMVYRAVVLRNHRLIHWPPGRFSIPVEFSQAAARFGHSLVRETYGLRPHVPTEQRRQGVDLGELFGSSRRRGSLPADKAVEWSHFIQSVEAPAKDLDTTLVNPFRNLPDDTIHSFVTSAMPHDPNMLAIRTLGRGAATRLPTGQQVRVALQPKAVLPVPPENAAWKKLRDLGFENETPLWFYILLEAEIQGGRERLGTIGSRLVAEVIEAALRHDPDSFLFQEGGQWTCPLWESSDNEKRLIQNLANLAVVIGLEQERKQPSINQV